MANIPKVVFKILIIGDAMVGKSCILQRYADDIFIENIQPTIGVDYRPVYRELRGLLTKLMIWDTAGQEKFKSITMSFYHGAHGAIVVYDVNRRETLYGLRRWIAELKRICGDVPLIIVGNKRDATSKSKLKDEEIAEYIEEIGFTDRHFLVSACTGENISKAFEALTDILLDSMKIYNSIELSKIALGKAEKERMCSC